MNNENKAKIFIALPNMLSVNSHLVQKLFQFAVDPNYHVWLHLVVEQRFHDYARNIAVKEFLRSPADWLLFIDSDVDPNPKLLQLHKHQKPIVAGVVFGWIKGRLMPSVWQRAPCEQCEVARIFQEVSRIHDPSQYKAEADLLYRWNGLHNYWEAFYDRAGTIGQRWLQKCRCEGVGIDPYVYRIHQGIFTKPNLVEVDSVGSAAVMIHREVLEKLEFPWFQFQYKKSREILITEDHYFCVKAKQAGFSVWCDTSMPCAHFKPLDLLAVNTCMENAYLKGGDDREEVLAKKAESSILLAPGFVEADQMKEIC